MFCGFNGLGLAMVIPCIQSLIADFSPADSRGRAFGAMNFVGAVGGCCSAVTISECMLALHAAAQIFSSVYANSCNHHFEWTHKLC